MKRILSSTLMIVLAVALVAGVTKAYFSSQAEVNDNTFSTGVLEVRVNGQEAITGVSLTNAAPGDFKSGSFGVQNYGAPWFGGPSTLEAKELTIDVANINGDSPLQDNVTLALFANAGWGGCSNPGVVFVPAKGCQIYNGLLTGMTEQDILHYTQWGAHPSLPAGNSITINYDFGLPNTDSEQNAMQGQTTAFDFVVTGYNPHR